MCIKWCSNLSLRLVGKRGVIQLHIAASKEVPWYKRRHWCIVLTDARRCRAHQRPTPMQALHNARGMKRASVKVTDRLATASVTRRSGLPKIV
jgi:hypothetical protein